jgi:hypothetical protein
VIQANADRQRQGPVADGVLAPDLEPDRAKEHDRVAGLDWIALSAFRIVVIGLCDHGDQIQRYQDTLAFRRCRHGL